MRVRASRLHFVFWGMLCAIGCSSETSPGKADSGAQPRDSGSTGDAAKTDAAPAACADSGSVAGDFLPCDVEAIVAVKCRRCHNTKDVLDECVPKKTCLRAPFPFLRWSDTRRDLGDGVRPVDLFAEAISSGFMPLQTKSVSPPVEPLTEDEKAVLLDWVGRCAPGSAEACSAVP